jgi:hypothetical protein
MRKDVLRYSAIARNPPLVFRHLQKSFYFHLGCLLDNLARLIYIINAPDAATRTVSKNNSRPFRCRIDWGDLRKEIENDYEKTGGKQYRGYRPFARSKRISQIINIRNGFTHGWYPPFVADPQIRALGWPVAIRTARDFYWPHDEREGAEMRKRYRKYLPINVIMRDDFAFMEAFQNRVFARLVRDVKKFERHNAVLIH